MLAHVALAAMLLGGASCERIYETEGDCDPYYFVEFIYDMNMEFADAFPAQVNSVKLMVYDAATGNFVKTFEETSEAILSEKGYRMPVDLKPGNYDFIAWCGLHNNEGQFVVADPAPTREALKCRLEARAYDGAQAVSQQELHLLFHGMVVRQNLPDQQGEHTVTIRLTRDTNTINLSLTQLGDKGMKPGQFSVCMADTNGWMGYNNALLTDEPIEYRPYYQIYGSEDFTAGGASNADDDACNYMRCELSTARLMVDHNPVIVVTDNESGKTVFSIPIVKWIRTYRSEASKRLVPDDQEYLDRENEYNVVLYIENNHGGWIAAQIEINGWRVRELGDTEL